MQNKDANTQALNWDDLRYLLELVRSGTVTEAAERLTVNQTTVSRRISALEGVLNAPLFDRTSRGWLLTPLGESLLPAVEVMADEVLRIGRSVKMDRQELSGKLRVTAPDASIQGLLMPGLNAFARRYPDIDVELIATEESLDLAVHDADIAFRATNEPPPNVVGSHIADFAYAVYASYDLYHQYEQNPGGVGGIAWTADGRSVPYWMQKCFPEMRVRYRANSIGATFSMARSGLGMALLPCGMGDASSKLRRIPVDMKFKTIGLWVLSHIDLRTTARIRIFRDHMIESIKPFIPLIEGRRPRSFEAPP